MKWVERRFPATDQYDGAKLFTHVDGKKLATPMFIVIMALGTTDLLFALDSIPAIYGLTKEPYLVLTANLFALMGLRQLYFLIGGLLKKLVYLSLGLAVLLAFIGVKLVLHALHENELPFINGGEHVDGRSGHPDLGLARRDRRHPRRHDRGQPVEVPQGRARAALSLLTLPGPCAGRRPSPGRWPAPPGPCPTSCSRPSRWSSTTQPGQRRGGGFEAEQDAEHPRAEVPQRGQLERVGQHRGQHRDAQALGDRLAGPVRDAGHAERAASRPARRPWPAPAPRASGTRGRPDRWRRCMPPSRLPRARPVPARSTRCPRTACPGPRRSAPPRPRPPRRRRGHAAVGTGPWRGPAGRGTRP